MTTLPLLFLGNSYTMNQSLDATVAEMLSEGTGEAWSGAKLAAGGLTFSSHVERAQGGHPDWVAALTDKGSQWDWVFLQEQSQIPGFPEDNAYVLDSVSAAETLCDYAADRGGQSVFVMTWGRRDGDPDNQARYSDFTTMQGHLTEGYLRYVAACTTPERAVWVAPAGLAWQQIHDDILADGGDPLADDSLFSRLYIADGSHPSPAGNHLAAAVIYATITGESPVGLSDSSGMVDDASLATLQAAAAAVVLGDSPDIDYPWEDGEDGETGEPEDTGELGDTGDGTTSEDTALPADAAADDTGPTHTVGAPTEDGGCRSGRALALPVLLLGLLGIRRR
ncbi:MAG: hypothetical protein ACI8RZ_001653 [Myxococcota bacterium]|jgi:hypothetical protein